MIAAIYNSFKGIESDLSFNKLLLLLLLLLKSFLTYILNINVISVPFISNRMADVAKNGKPEEEEDVSIKKIFSGFELNFFDYMGLKLTQCQ